MKYLFFTFVAVVLFALSCNGQPRSDWQLEWSAEPSSVNYMVFVETGSSSNPADYVLQDGMDYKDGAEGLVVTSTTNLTYTLTDVDNSGGYVVYGVVGINSEGIYGAMGVIQPYLLPTVPGKILVLPPVRL